MDNETKVESSQQNFTSANGLSETTSTIFPKFYWPMQQPTKTIDYLAITHVVAAVILGGIILELPYQYGHTLELGGEYVEISISYLFPVFLGLLLAQTTLLGIWFGVQIANRQMRSFDAIATLAYLGPMFSLVVKRPLFMSIFFSAFLVLCKALAFLVLRNSFIRLEYCEQNEAPAYKGLQFSIRQIMAITFLVAVMLSLGPWLKTYSIVWELSIAIVVINPFFPPVGFVSAFAMLDKSPPQIGWIYVLLIAAIIGNLSSYLCPEPVPCFWLCVSMADAVFLLASFWVIRRCGFRLVRVS